MASRLKGRRRWWVSAATLTILAFFAVVFVGASSANLANSSFEGSDGNLVVDTAGNHDWANAPNLSVGTDLQTGQNDNSFGNGTKEDNSSVTVGTGSIPNSKADLARFAVAGEVIQGDTFMYLAWTRENQSGTVNFDFELNKLQQPDLTTAGAKTLNRSVGDELINYAFAGGSNTPTLTKFHWGGSNWVSDGVISNVCEEGATNSQPVNDTLGSPPNAVVSRPAQQFGEAAINMTCAGIVPKNACSSFGSAYVKSRSSTSFTSEIKDFIAPIPIHISNCGQVIIRKVTVPSPDPLDSSFSYSATGGLSPAAFSLKNGGVQDYGNQVHQGSYTVTEADPGPNYVLSSLNCSASDLSHGSTVSTSAGTASFTLAALDKIDCTYTNTLQQGAIKITKTSIKAAGTPLSGAVFSIKDSQGNAVTGSPATTGSNGTVCVDHLLFGTYSVQETKAPDGYAIDDNTAHNVTVSKNSTCGDGNEATFSATDTPLTDISAHAKSQATGGTKSTITCSDGTNTIASSGANPSDPADASATSLKPGTYTCTIVIDP